MKWEVTENQAKLLGLTHVIEQLLMPDDVTSTNPRPDLKKYFQSYDWPQFFYDLASVFVAPIWYQTIASVHLLQTILQVVPDIVQLFDKSEKEDPEKNKLFEKSLSFLHQYLISQGQAIASPFLNALSLLCQCLLTAYRAVIESPKETSMAVFGFFKNIPIYIGQNIASNFNQILSQLGSK